MPTPAFVDAGAGSSTTGTSLALSYPGTVNANDFLVLDLYAITASITTPSGWTSITSVASGGNSHCYYKIADGTEGGTTLTVTFGTTSPNRAKFGRIYRFTGGGSVEGAGSSSGVTNGITKQIPDQGVTTSGTGRLAVNLVKQTASMLAMGNFTGMTGGTWSEAVAEYTSATDTTAALQIQTASMPTAATIDNGVETLSAGGKTYHVMGFAIIPATIKLGQAVETDSAFPMTPVKGTPGLRVVLGLASETDSAFAMTAAKGGPDLDFAVSVDFGNGFEDLGSSETTDTRMTLATVQRGRTFNLDIVQAGNAQLTLDNADGQLDPSNADSQWFGHILPVNPLRIFRRKDTVTYNFLNGLVETWVPQWLNPDMQYVQITATDRFDSLSSDPIVSGTSTLTTVFGSNKDLTYTATEAGENGDSVTVTYVVAGNNTPLTTSTNDPLSGNAVGLGKYKNTASGLTFIPGHQSVGTSVPPVPIAVTISGTDITVNLATNGGGTPTSTANDVLTLLAADPDAKALVTVTLAPGSTGAGVLGAMGQTSLAGGKWPSELTGTRINRVLDLIGWDPTLRAIDDGVTLVIERGFSVADNESALAHIQEVADAELGLFFLAGDGTATFHDAVHRSTATRSTTIQAVFSDDGTGFEYTSIVPTLDKDRIVNSASVTSGNQSASPQVANDTYSQTGVGAPPVGATAVPPGGFGTRSIARTTQLASDADALSQAGEIVDAFAYPLLRFDEITTIEPPGATEADFGVGEFGDDSFGGSLDSSAWVQAVLGLEISDLITVKTTPPATNTTTAFNAFVEQITDTLIQGMPWSRTLKLSPLSQAVTTGGGGGGGGGTGAMLNTLGGPLILDDATNGVIA